MNSSGNPQFGRNALKPNVGSLPDPNDSSLKTGDEVFAVVPGQWFKLSGTLGARVWLQLTGPGGVPAIPSNQIAFGDPGGSGLLVSDPHITAGYDPGGTQVQIDRTQVQSLVAQTVDAVPLVVANPLGLASVSLVNRIAIAARDNANGDSAGWIFHFLLREKAGVLGFGSSGLVQTFHDFDPGAATWAFAITLNSPGPGDLLVTVKGQAGRTVDWSLGTFNVLAFGP